MPRSSESKSIRERPDPQFPPRDPRQTGDVPSWGVPGMPLTSALISGGFPMPPGIQTSDDQVLNAIRQPPHMGGVAIPQAQGYSPMSPQPASAASMSAPGPDPQMMAMLSQRAQQQPQGLPQPGGAPQQDPGASQGFMAMLMQLLQSLGMGGGQGQPSMTPAPNLTAQSGFPAPSAKGQ